MSKILPGAEGAIRALQVERRGERRESRES